MRNDPRNIMPGDRVKVFDALLFKDDRVTPLSHTVRPATVVRRYGALKQVYKINDLTLGPYPDLVDVVFDHRPKTESCGHFTNGVETL
jgi:hypothetical protein